MKTTVNTLLHALADSFGVPATLRSAIIALSPAEVRSLHEFVLYAKNYAVIKEKGALDSKMAADLKESSDKLQILRMLSISSNYKVTYLHPFDLVSGLRTLKGRWGVQDANFTVVHKNHKVTLGPIGGLCFGTPPETMDKKLDSYCAQAEAGAVVRLKVAPYRGLCALLPFLEIHKIDGQLKAEVASAVTIFGRDVSPTINLSKPTDVTAKVSVASMKNLVRAQVMADAASSINKLESRCPDGVPILNFLVAEMQAGTLKLPLPVLSITDAKTKVKTPVKFDRELAKKACDATKVSGKVVLVNKPGSDKEKERKLVYDAGYCPTELATDDKTTGVLTSLVNNTQLEAQSPFATEYFGAWGAFGLDFITALWLADFCLAKTIRLCVVENASVARELELLVTGPMKKIFSMDGNIKPIIVSLRAGDGVRNMDWTSIISMSAGKRFEEKEDLENPQNVFWAQMPSGYVSNMLEMTTKNSLYVAFPQIDSLSGDGVSSHGKWFAKTQIEEVLPLEYSVRPTVIIKFGPKIDKEDELAINAKIRKEIIFKCNAAARVAITSWLMWNIFRDLTPYTLHNFKGWSEGKDKVFAAAHQVFIERSKNFAPIVAAEVVSTTAIEVSDGADEYTFDTEEVDFAGEEPVAPVAAVEPEVGPHPPPEEEDGDVEMTEAEKAARAAKRGREAGET